MSEIGIRVIESAALPYLLSVPPAAGEDESPLPLLFFLHGFGEAAPVEIRWGVARHGPLRRGSAHSALERFIVAAPQLPRAGDLWHQFADAVREIVEDVGREHPLDAARLYLTGFSFGGNGVFDLGLEQPDLWAALWAVDPTRVPREVPPQPIWLSVGEVARHRIDMFTRSLQLEPLQDGSPGGDRVLVDEGLDHVESAATAYADDRIYQWLLGRTLDSSPPLPKSDPAS
jgi:poly(3-hydroxybutyrate) depolymerase